MPPQQNADDEALDHRGGDDDSAVASSNRLDLSPPLAATAKFGRSPTLRRAVPSCYPPTLPRHLRFAAHLSTLVIPALFYLGPLMLAAPLLLLAVSAPRAAGAMLLLDVVLAFVPVKEWPHFRQYFQLWYSVFDFRHNLDISTDANDASSGKDQVEDTSLIIYSAHPHGVIPLHGYLWCAFCDQHFPHRYGFGALTDIALRLPILRHVMGWLSSETARKDVLVRRLTGQGDNLYILPGGVAEIFMACPGRHVIKAPRRGLIKLALQTGAVLVPMYVFGVDDFYDQLATYGSAPDHQSDPANWVGRVQKKISRSVRGGFTFFWGRYFLPLPYETKCSMVLGDPIEPVPGTLGQERTLGGNKKTCAKVAHPTEEQIDELSTRYTSALMRLFDQYKEQAGYPRAKLVIR